MKDKNKKPISIIKESSAILISSLIIILEILFRKMKTSTDQIILIMCALLNTISACMIIAYARSFHKTDQLEDPKYDYVCQIPEKRSEEVCGPGSDMIRQYIPTDDLNEIHLSKNVSMSQGCNLHTANVLVIGDSESGMHQWVKHNLLSGNANYVVVNIDHEYDAVYQSLMDRDYTIHHLRITDHEEYIPDNALNDIPCKKKQVFSVDVNVKSLSQELAQMRLTYAAACVYDMEILILKMKNHICEPHIQFYVDETVTPHLYNIQTMMQAARPLNIGICLMAESIDSLQRLSDGFDVKSGFMQTALACHAILYMGSMEHQTTNRTTLAFDLEGVLKENESITDLPYNELIGWVNGITFRDQKI